MGKAERIRRIVITVQYCKHFYLSPPPNLRVACVVPLIFRHI